MKKITVSTVTHHTRLPKVLHAKLIKQAQSEHRSLNRHIVFLLDLGVDVRNVPQGKASK